MQEFSELHPVCRQYLAQQSDLLDRLVPAVQSLEHYLDQPLQHHNYQDALKVFEIVVLRWGCAMNAHELGEPLSSELCGRCRHLALLRWWGCEMVCKGSLSGLSTGCH